MPAEAKEKATAAASAELNEVKMPQLGESVVEGTIGRWLREPGQFVARNESLVEVITDKVTVEVPSPFEGLLASIEVEAGQTVPVGTVIARVRAAGSAPQSSGAPAPGGFATAAPPEAQAQSTSSTPPAAAAAPEAAAAPAAGTGGDAGRGRFSPAVRRLAAEAGIDPATLSGTGEGGRVTRADVERAVAQRNAQAATPAAAPAAAVSLPASGAAAAPAVTAPAAGVAAPAGAAATGATTGAPGSAAVHATPAGAVEDEETLQPNPIRQMIARRMVESWTTIPHAWATVESDVTPLVAVREAVKDEFYRRERFELTYLPFVIKAVVETLREFPILNATWQDGSIVVKRRVHVGIAVGLEEALLVPVIRDADRLSVAGLARAAYDLISRARSGKLTPDDTRGGTFTVNNTGALGSTLSMPIINPPQGAILTSEAIVKRVVVLPGDAIAVRSMMNLCLSFDHRLCDGVQALRFLNGVKRRLEAYGVGTPIY